MADPRRAFEMAEDHIDQMWEDGQLSDAERNAELRELARDYAAMAEEAARDAYESERDRW